jgi:hypothetical protein
MGPGDSYIGTFRSGQFHGFGAYISEDRGVYEGNFEKNKFSGFGIKCYPNVDRFEGNWENGKMNGFGLLTFGHSNSGNAVSYEGNFEKDVRSGPNVIKLFLSVTYKFL